MEIILAEPRGFCAGVTRAIDIVNLALEKFGSPLYVKHEIVHNKIVVESLKSRGVIFTDDISIVPKGSVLIYSAHGVSDKIEEQAKELQLIEIDATCPLVKKVHKEVSAFDSANMQILLVGHKNHPEIEGTAGKIKNRPAIIIETVEDAKNLEIPEGVEIGLATQTTLSMDDTKEIIETLISKFPKLEGAVKNDICYATQNRQTAVKKLIEDYKIEALIVVGSQNSSNSNRLKQLGESHGISSFLINTVNEIDSSTLLSFNKIGITAGASAPEELVMNIIEFFKTNANNIEIKTMDGIKEDVIFHIPKILR